MLGLVLAMHAPLGSAMASCVAHIMGSRPDNFEVVDVDADVPTEQTVERIKKAAIDVDSGAGVVFMTDLFGATPSNVVVKAIEEAGIGAVLVSGCNLPMIIRFLGLREVSLAEAAKRLVDGGRSGIVSVNGVELPSQSYQPAE